MLENYHLPEQMMHTPISDLQQSQVSQAGLSLSAFLLILIAITFLAVIRASFVLLCTNMADAILASTRVETGTSRAIKAGFSAA